MNRTLRNKQVAIDDTTFLFRWRMSTAYEILGRASSTARIRESARQMALILVI